jgi:DNA-directed RNA polymerase subunit omega
MLCRLEVGGFTVRGAGTVALSVDFPPLHEVRAPMASRQDTMMNPSIEELFDRAGSKFSLVTLSAMRARQINAYFNQLGEGLGAIVPPQVTSVARKPLSIAFEEIASDKIVMVHPSEQAEAEAAAAPTEGE